MADQIVQINDTGRRINLISNGGALQRGLLSHKVFQEIGEVCGGWLATLEETKLRNHMKWARILVANEGKSIPKEVAISQNGIKFYIPIWSESKP
ncbi:hypothetical protein KY289_033660 [Solanum tuberosum]|nr:hypothetical protein KY289_033660 [Solanum tuberosum]